MYFKLRLSKSYFTDVYLLLDHDYKYDQILNSTQLKKQTSQSGFNPKMQQHYYLFVLIQCSFRFIFVVITIKAKDYNMYTKPVLTTTLVYYLL